MKKYLIACCGALVVAAIIAPDMAHAQPKKRPSSMVTQGPKKGGSIYKPNRSAPVQSRSRVAKPRRNHGVSPSPAQMRRSAELAAKRGSAASSFLSRIKEGPLNPKIDTRRMSTDVNAPGGRALPKPTGTPPPPAGSPPPLPPRPSASGAPRGPSARALSPQDAALAAAQAKARGLARQIKPVKVTVKSIPVPAASKQRGILVGDRRASAHGTRGLTFNGKDQFKSVGGRITKARNGRGTGFLDRLDRKWKTWRGKD